MIRPIVLTIFVTSAAGCGSTSKLDTARDATTFSAKQISSIPFMASSEFEGATTMTGELHVEGFGVLGYSIATDSNGNSSFLAAPLEPQDSLPQLNPATNGAADFNGTWGIAFQDDTSAAGDHGTIEIAVDFETGKVAGVGGDLQINGAIEDGKLIGMSSFKGVNGTVQGVIGNTALAGFFVGPSYAGAFAVAE